MKEPSLIEIWCEHLAKVLEFMAGETVATTWMLDAAANLPNSVDRWIELRFSEGAAWLCVPPLSWKGLGALMLGAKEFTDDQTELAESTWLEVVAQVSAGVAAALSARIDREIRPLRPAIGEAEASGASRYVVGVRVAGSDFPLVLAFGKDLHRVLDQAPTRTPAQARPRDEEFEKPSDIDLLMDVELPISVSFGHTYMPLREVLKLTTGSLIELDRLVSDPVDLVVNNCIVARGEVVIVEGSYGVRIQEVISRSERLALRKQGKPLPPYHEFRLKSGA